MSDTSSDTPRFPFLFEPPLADVLACLNATDGETRVVGGAVRNVLMGQASGDIDLATTLLPPDVIRCARAAGFKAVPTGIEHGTVTVIADGVPFEVTTLRKDIRTDGRCAEVAFGTDWNADAARRDFTINALYLEADGTLHDPMGGLSDIKARRIRFIGAPKKRITEDYLRILRFFRFHAGYAEGTPEAAVLSVIEDNLDGLGAVSAERVRMELARMLPMPGALANLEAMQSIGLLARLIGEDANPAAVGRLAFLQRVVPPPVPETAWILRLGALVGRHAFADTLATRLRLSNAEKDRLARFIADMAEPLDPRMPEDSAKAAIYRLGKDAYLDRLAASWVANDGSETLALGAYAALAALAMQWSPPDLPLSGKDLVEAGLDPGPKLGETLRVLEEAWIVSGFALTRDQLIERAVQTPH